MPSSSHSVKSRVRRASSPITIRVARTSLDVPARPPKELYSADESSMDTLDMKWTLQHTSGFITIQAIRIEKYAARKIKDGEPLARV
ncbi:hypothetical protein F66182_8354 [Fusarium sp. NRRL 66182]|nr:hypothetical protein F66182_8354 [Fusarium sp. NRRL 66182]